MGQGFILKGSEIMHYDKGKHTIYHNRYHIIWIIKYRFKVLKGEIRKRVREITRQVCEELGVSIISGVLSMDHFHMYISIPPHRAVSDVMRRIKGRTSRKIQMEFPELKQKYWGRHFWARGYFCTTSGAVNEETILQYIEKHTPNSTGISR
jgi:putative transposase